MGLFGRNMLAQVAGMAQPMVANALARDPADQTANYNTPLSPQEEARFQAWVKASGRERDLYDYDLRGAWKKNTKAATNGHLPDTWKKPNHPTFSRESIYSGPYATGGEWAPLPNNQWQFNATDDNLRYRSPQELQQYFKQVEPGNLLNIPQKRR